MPKKKYYPNNWKKIKSVPDEYFDHELTIEEFMEWRVNNWEIPSSVACIIREENSITGLITEYTYQRPSAAKKKVKQLMDKGHEFLIANADQVQLMTPQWEDEDDEHE